MTRRTVTSLALAAGCAIALAIPAAQAQMTDTQVLTNTPRINAGDRADWMAARNNAESAQYERLLETSPAFRQARMRKECGPITDAQLHQNCLASFAQDEPRGGNPSADNMTGSSTGTMTTTGSNPDTYGEGSGSSSNYTTPRNSFGASRNLPAEQSGMVQAPGAMPNYPGPRPSGPLSGGGR
jgi:hypothetical protein